MQLLYFMHLPRIVYRNSLFVVPFRTDLGLGLPNLQTAPCPLGGYCGAPFRSAYIYYITLALATRRSEASSQLRHNRLRPLSLNSAGLK